VARLTYSEHEVARLLGVDANDSLDELIRDGTLRVLARARDGRRIFDAVDVRRAASELALTPRVRGPRKRST
jgi:hypothetical protein